jgi:hypothetical protein
MLKKRFRRVAAIALILIIINYSVSVCSLIIFLTVA